MVAPTYKFEVHKTSTSSYQRCNLVSTSNLVYGHSQRPDGNKHCSQEIPTGVLRFVQGCDRDEKCAYASERWLPVTG